METSKIVEMIEPEARIYADLHNAVQEYVTDIFVMRPIYTNMQLKEKVFQKAVEAFYGPDIWKELIR